MLADIRKEIMVYGLGLIDKLHPIVLGSVSDTPLTKYEDVFLKQGDYRHNSLYSILSKITLDSSSQELWHISPAELSLNRNILFPTSDAEKTNNDYLKQVYQKLDSLKNAHNFTKYYYTFLKYCWSIPTTIDFPEISLFDQWKTISAMAFASGDQWYNGPAEEFTLVGGDIPGIQNFVYTITSKGAAKGLKGRSYFIQLLGETIITSMLKKWGLEITNIIYAAGGNFMILAPNTVDVSVTRDETEKTLFSYFEGNLGFCLADQTIPCNALAKDEFSEYSSRLKEKISAQKQNRFSKLAKSNWSMVFAPQGKPGNRFCAICQVALREDEGKRLFSEDESVDDRQCSVCATLENLANKIRSAKYEIKSPKLPENPEHWQEILFGLGEICFDYYDDREFYHRKDDIVLAINDTSLEEDMDGFKFVAAWIPTLTQKDVDHGNESGIFKEIDQEVGDILTFGQLAKASQGVNRLGVLRMDVDNLGMVVMSGLPHHNILSLSCLSRTLDWFFEGWLNRICEEINQNDDGQLENRLFIIYAGGDDLFIVGSWDLMPELAFKIQSDLQAYSGNNPNLTISAGISIVPEKYPLYQAARDTGEAQDQSKLFSRSSTSHEKNAFTFFGQTFGWEEYEEIAKLRDKITQIASENKAIIRILSNIYNQYLSQAKQTTDPLGRSFENILYGPWMWRSVYALSQLSRRINDEDKKKLVKEIQNSFLKKPHHVGLANRWAELLIREEER